MANRSVDPVATKVRLPSPTSGSFGTYTQYTSSYPGRHFSATPSPIDPGPGPEVEWRDSEIPYPWVHCLVYRHTKPLTLLVMSPQS